MTSRIGTTRGRYTVKHSVKSQVQRDAVSTAWASIAMTAVRYRDQGDHHSARHYASRARILIEAFGVRIVPRVCAISSTAAA